VVNGKLSYTFPVGDWGTEGEVFVSGKNLTDTDYAYRPGYPMPGINGMIGVKFSL
jgi:iron complex outermembrane receptor protein